MNGNCLCISIYEKDSPKTWENPVLRRPANRNGVETAQEFRYVLSCHGNKMLVLSNYKYTRDGQTGDRVRWYCSVRKTQHCKASVITVDDKIVKNRADLHNHPPSLMFTRDQ
ncbi:Uncharacterized protein OBRU01_16398 [Operophtera brumata]|uniref:FLYWCH-type domain-containing protein n=1 Tax=Operophtera brumata TaxID=104452 RepID=A0A0L7L2K9_OPEBR|nr:Uncharacterized protein OBRU01_16398 [Operophtera brumata]